MGDGGMAGWGNGGMGGGMGEYVRNRTPHASSPAELLSPSGPCSESLLVLVHKLLVLVLVDELLVLVLVLVHEDDAMDVTEVL